MPRVAWYIVNIATVLALCVVLLGAWTRISDAGLSCPDWPGCYGHMVMPREQMKLEQAQLVYPDTPIELHKTHLEMGHRYLAGTLGILIAWLAVIGFRQRGTQGYPTRLSYILLALVILQAGFGMWTVTLKLYPPVVTLHLLGGVFTLMLLLVLRNRLQEFRQPPTVNRKQYPSLIVIALAILIIQIAAGGWTSSNYAGPACSHWFGCNPGSMIIPDFATGFDPTVVIGPDYQGGYLPIEARAAIQIGHRLGAVAVVLISLLLFFKLRGNKSVRSELTLWMVGVCIQLVLGVLNVIWAVPTGLAMAHHAVAIFLLVMLLRIAFKLTVVKEGT